MNKYIYVNKDQKNLYYYDSQHKRILQLNNKYLKAMIPLFILSFLYCMIIVSIIQINLHNTYFSSIIRTLIFIIGEMIGIGGCYLIFSDKLHTLIHTYSNVISEPMKRKTNIFMYLLIAFIVLLCITTGCYLFIFHGICYVLLTVIALVLYLCGVFISFLIV